MCSDNHEHKHEHSHVQSLDSDKSKLRAILYHNLQHNEKHIEELTKMAEKALELNFTDAAEGIIKSVEFYKKGNKMLDEVCGKL